MDNTMEIIFMYTKSKEFKKHNSGDQQKHQAAPIAPSNPDERKKKVIDEPGAPEPKVAPLNHKS